MENMIYTITLDTYITKAFGREVNEVITSTNYKYYTTLESANKALNEHFERMKGYIEADKLEIEWINHENVGSPTEFYWMKLKNVVRPVGVYTTPLELGE